MCTSTRRSKRTLRSAKQVRMKRVSSDGSFSAAPDSMSSVICFAASSKSADRGWFLKASIVLQLNMRPGETNERCTLQRISTGELQREERRTLVDQNYHGSGREGFQFCFQRLDREKNSMGDISLEKQTCRVGSSNVHWLLIELEDLMRDFRSDTVC